MLKVVVFDGGWGGEAVASYIEHELSGAVEVVRLIDWAHAPYGMKSRDEILNLAIQWLAPYVGKTDLIVLGGYATSLILSDLRERYPEQKFVGVSVNYDMICRARKFPGQVVIMASQAVNDSVWKEELREKLAYSTLILPDCSGWEELIDVDLMNRDVLRTELRRDFLLKERYKERSTKTMPAAPTISVEAMDRSAMLSDNSRDVLELAILKFASAAKAAADDERIAVEAAQEMNEPAPDEELIEANVVLLLNTHFWDLKEDLEHLFGWGVRVLDFREKLLHDVCIALKLRGVHGKRAK